MRPQPEIIRLGAHEWRVRPLTLAQVQAIEPILLATQETKGPVATGNVAAAIAIVSVALGRDYPTAVDSLPEIEATAGEIGAAMTSVLRLGGFIETRSDKGASNLAGESEAGAIQQKDASA